MNRSGWWHKGLAFALILLMVFLAAAISAPAVEAADPYYTHDYDEIWTQMLEPGGEAHSLILTIGIEWDGATKRAVNTSMNAEWICPGDGYNHLNLDFNPQTFILGIDQTQAVNITVSAKEEAADNNYIIEITAEDLDEHSINTFYIRLNPLVLSVEGCFIATAAYGTSTAAEIDTLRAFRDEVLLESTLGSQLVEWYYQTSPPLADFISEHEGLRTLVRELLVEPVVWVVDAIGILWRD
jgi:hypothetical protein